MHESPHVPYPNSPAKSPPALSDARHNNDTRTTISRPIIVSRSQTNGAVPRSRQYAIIENRTTIPGAVVRHISTSPQKQRDTDAMERIMQEYYMGAASSVREYVGKQQQQRGNIVHNVERDDAVNRVSIPRHPVIVSSSASSSPATLSQDDASDSHSPTVFERNSMFYTLKSPVVSREEYGKRKVTRQQRAVNARVAPYVTTLSASYDASAHRSAPPQTRSNAALSTSMDSIVKMAAHYTLPNSAQSSRTTISNTVLTSPPQTPATAQGGDTPGTPRDVARKKRVKRLRVYTSMAKNQVVFESIRSLKWHTTHNASHADLIWLETSSRNQTIASLISKPHQKVSRFPGMHKCVSKYHMAQHLERMRRFFKDEYEFVPKTFLFPDDVATIYALDNEKDTQATYIVKPAQGSQGNGITLTQNIKKTCLALETKHGHMGQKFVLQRYLEKPYLLEGLKFDLRLYVLIESIDPLKVYIFEEGLTRFCTVPYTRPTGANLDQVYMHLSNYSLNKYNENFVESEDPMTGSKRSLKAYFDALARAGENPHAVWESIKDMVVKTCIAILPDLKFFFRSAFHHGGGRGTAKPHHFSAQSPAHCFQLLGFDIMMDSKSKPWLIELNHHPSFTISARADEVKKLVVCRAMKVVAFNILYRKLPAEEKEEKWQRYMAQYCKGWELIEQCESKENRRLLLFSLDPLIDAFIQSCGVKSKDDLTSHSGCLMVASKFYKFARDYGILDSPQARNQISRVQLDLLFIDAQKKANTAGGITFQQFLEILICLAKKMYQPNKPGTSVSRNKRGKHTDDLKCFLTFLSNHILNRSLGDDSQRVSSASTSGVLKSSSDTTRRMGSVPRTQTSHGAMRQQSMAMTHNGVLRRQKSLAMM